MKKPTATKMITFILLIQILFISGCAAENQNSKENNAEPTSQNNTVLDNTTNNFSIATKNTSRILGSTAEEISISTSFMIWPASENANRPNIVLIAPSESWQTQLITVDLIHHPSDGPLLITSKDKISDTVINELARLNPKGGNNGIEIITVGMSDNANKQLTEKGYNIYEITGDNVFKLAEDIDEYYGSMAGELPSAVIVASSEDAEYSIPAANWIAHMAEPLLYVKKDEIPLETKSALEKRNGNANIYVLGPEAIISKKVEDSLQSFGKVTRISGDTPYANAIALAKYRDKDTGFGWGITMPGHGLLIVNKDNIKDSIASGAFSHRGKHAPLLITDSNKSPQELLDYLKDLKPFFENDPTEGPYTHLYITGNTDWISLEQQGNLDNLIEIESAIGDSHGNTDSNKMHH